MKTISKYIIFSLLIVLSAQPLHANKNEPLFAIYKMSESQIKDTTNHFVTAIDQDHKKYLVDSEKIIEHKHLTKARAILTSYRSPAIDIWLNQEGTKRLADFSKKYIGKQFVIVLKGKVVSAPLVQEPIHTGAAQITGNFSIDQTKQIAAELNAITKN